MFSIYLLIILRRCMFIFYVNISIYALYNHGFIVIFLHYNFHCCCFYFIVFVDTALTVLMYRIIIITCTFTVFFTDALLCVLSAYADIVSPSNYIVISINIWTVSFKFWHLILFPLLNMLFCVCRN